MVEAASRGHPQLQARARRARAASRCGAARPRCTTRRSEVHSTLAALRDAACARATRRSPTRRWCTPGRCIKEHVALRERRAQPDRRFPGRHANSHASTGVPIARQGLQDRPDVMKTIVAPGLKARMLGIRGWFSTNILGNRDGEVLDDPDSFKTKEVSQARRARNDLAADIAIPSCTADIVPQGSHRVLPAARRRRRKAGTTSTSSDGSAIRCRSRSTSCAATRSWRRRSCSISCCSWTSRSAPGFSGIQEWL